MPTEANSPRLTLRFVTKPRLELRATEFHLPKTPNGPITVKASEGKAGDGFFEWREGTQALCLCLIRFLFAPKEQLEKGIAFVFEGGEQSSAKTLDGVIAKCNKANCWQFSVFGYLVDGGCRLKGLIKRRNPDRRDQERNYELEVQHRAIPQESIIVEADGSEVKDKASLERLADTIEDQWYEITGNTSELPKIKAARKARAKGDAARAKASPPKRSAKTTPAGELNPEAARETPAGSAPPPQPAKPLADLFKSLSVASIKSHIIAELMPGRGAPAVQASLAELLASACVNVMAERLTSESLDSFCQFYCGSYDDSQNIKKSIAAVIASHPELRKRLAAMVARSGFYDMKAWFHAFSTFCDREILYDLEQAMNVAAEEPSFKEKFLPYAPERLPELIECFSRHGCVCAVRIFEKINQEGKEEEQRVNRIIYGDRRPDKS